MSILVIEDDNSLLKLATMLLELSGHVAFSASTTEDAIEKVKIYHPTTILCDYMLATSNCIELVKAISLLYKENLPNIIIMSAWPNYKDFVKNIQAVEYLDKPFDLDRFDEIFKKYH